MGLIIVLKTRKVKIIPANVENFGKKGNLLQRISKLFEEKLSQFFFFILNKKFSNDNCPTPTRLLNTQLNKCPTNT